MIVSSFLKDFAKENVSNIARIMSTVARLGASRPINHCKRTRLTDRSPSIEEVKLPPGKRMASE